MDIVTKIWAEIMKPLELIGFLGQFVFFLRFAVQWIASEKKKAVVVPEAFWWFSIIGGAITLVYGVMKPAPPVVMAQILVIPLYSRNLFLQRRAKKRLATPLQAE